ncbi:hypothetical protein NDU88_003831 [Pleurodeles waltl]|uniref:Secreted protein n=1 Tax=Pleurodeles waltl TaxID=8319 RepID=A0AAV7W394_PLEWA|nr:hypothetical protein NDU88_003831 [Pleurodeles waltl]
MVGCDVFFWTLNLVFFFSSFQDLAVSLWSEKKRDLCSPCSAPFLHLPAFLYLPPPDPFLLVPHPVPGVAKLLLKRGGSFTKLPGVSSLHQGIPSAPIPALFRSSGERSLRLWCRRPLEPFVLL